MKVVHGHRNKITGAAGGFESTHGFLGEGSENCDDPYVGECQIHSIGKHEETRGHGTPLS